MSLLFSKNFICREVIENAAIQEKQMFKFMSSNFGKPNFGTKAIAAGLIGSLICIAQSSPAAAYLAGNASSCYSFNGWKNYSGYVNFIYSNSCGAKITVYLYDSNGRRISSGVCGPNKSQCARSMPRDQANRVSRSCVEYTDYSIRQEVGDRGC